MPKKNWEMVSQSASGAMFINRDATQNAIVPYRNAEPIKLAISNSRASFRFKGPDGSPMTERALDIAERMASR